MLEISWNKYRDTISMDEKNIVLYERHDGVRFVLERSLQKFKQKINIYSSHWKNDTKQMIANENVDLLITELSRINPDGLEISHYARKLDPDLKIMWITVLGCHNFCDQKAKLGNICCFEKPLEINEFRQDVLEALDIDI